MTIELRLYIITIIVNAICLLITAYFFARWHKSGRIERSVILTKVESIEQTISVSLESPLIYARGLDEVLKKYLHIIFDNSNTIADSNELIDYISKRHKELIRFFFDDIVSQKELISVYVMNSLQICYRNIHNLNNFSNIDKSFFDSLDNILMLENEKFKNDLYFILRDVKNSKKARVYNRLCSFLEKAYDIIITKYTSWQWEKFGTNNGVEISASETEKKSVEHIRDILVSDKLRELYSELLKDNISGVLDSIKDLMKRNIQFNSSQKKKTLLELVDTLQTLDSSGNNYENDRLELKKNISVFLDTFN